MRAGPRLVAALLVIGAALTGCSANATSSPSPAASSPSPAASDASPVDGVIVDVQATGLDQVSGFTLLVRGQRMEFKLGPLENPTQFPPGHLKEHQATATPVRVYFTLSDGARVAYRLEDAPG